MTRWVVPVLLLLGILCGTCAWAQNDTEGQDTGAPTQPGPKPAYTYPDAAPSLDFLTQSVENSSLTLGLGAGFSYDSNAYSTGTATNQNFWLFHVTPSIKIQQFRPKLSWNVYYAPGFQEYSYTQKSFGSSNGNNLFSQRASAGFIWQMSPHWQLQANEAYTFSANPFDSYLTTPGTPTMNNPNPVTYYPLTQYTLNNALLTLTDQLTKVDTLSFTGTESLRNTSTYNLLTTVPFYNLVSYGGRASYSHRFSPRLSLGADYDYNSLDFGNGQQRSGTQTISMTADYLIRPNMSISGWVGPEYTGTKTTVFIPILNQTFITHDSMWSTSAGASFAWHGRRDSITAGFARQVSDGGGILATTQVNSVNGSYRRMFTQKMDLTVGLRYFHDVSTTASSRSFDNFNANASLNYKLTRSLTASAQYSYLKMNQSTAILLGTNNYNANMVGVTVNYTWNHPLGR